jgi:hypothetical protein
VIPSSAMRSALVLLLVVLASGCDGGSSGGAASSPLGAAENALTLASRGEALALAKTLASGPRGKAEVDIQLEMLGEWLLLRAGGGARLGGTTLEGWDALRLEDSTSATATVATVLRFRHPTEAPLDRPVPLEIDLVHEGGAWRIADARMKPLPGWFEKLHEDEHPPFPGETPEPVQPPNSLAEIAGTFRPPPKNWKR